MQTSPPVSPRRDRRDEPDIADAADLGSRRSPAALVGRAAAVLVDGVRKVARPVVTSVGRPLASALAGRPPKRISAMLRVKNEEEFLAVAALSVLDLVDELVIVDNASEDSTPTIIARLAGQHPDKVRAFVYPHRIARYGDEHIRLASTRSGRRSPEFLPRFYNWSVQRCTHPYILKWDGDTVATEALAPTLEAFRSSRSQILWYTGVNLHESRDHMIRGRPFEDVEPRLFYRRFSHYGNSMGYVEALWSPYLGMYPEFSERVADPLYFHLKFCKRDRFSNLSADRRELEEQNATIGAPLAAGLQRQVAALGI